jgi:hypothetical protein
MTTVTIASHFHGPPESGNGGYTCGLFAATLGFAPARIRLRVPPPLDRPLLVQHRGDVSVLLDGDTVVFEARPGTVDVTAPPPIGYEDAVAARDAFDVDAYAAQHAFPSCFTCGPHRTPGAGLRLFPVPVADRPAVIASPWVPDDSVAGDDGLVRAEILWAALDCPSGLAWIGRDPTTGPSVLGELAVSIVHAPTPGDELVVAGWQVEAEGRKRDAGSAIWNASGELIASAQATWVVLAPTQQESFNTATS